MEFLIMKNNSWRNKITWLVGVLVLVSMNVHSDDHAGDGFELESSSQSSEGIASSHCPSSMMLVSPGDVHGRTHEGERLASSLLLLTCQCK